MIVPGVAGPSIVRVLSGAAVVEERELGGPWLKTRVETGVAQALAVHLARNYTELSQDVRGSKGGLPGFKLRKTTELMAANLEEEFSLIRLAREADMSEFHFSRLFKRTTGLTPSQYFIHLRMENRSLSLEARMNSR
jgi:transcriptional regulator GlxA family with amidase domain